MVFRVVILSVQSTSTASIMLSSRSANDEEPESGSKSSKPSNSLSNDGEYPLVVELASDSLSYSKTNGQSYVFIHILQPSPSIYVTWHEKIGIKFV